MTSSSLTLNANCSAHSFGSHNGHQNITSPKTTTLYPMNTAVQGVAQYIEALDHLSTKLKIPMVSVEPTNALQDDGLVPGICRLYLEGRCRQGNRCFQVHTSLDVVERLRKEALETPSCCHIHGAQCNYEGLPFNLRVNIGNQSVGLHSLSPTNCLWAAYNEHGNNDLNLAKGRVCREHRRGLCRFGDECGFLHICREIALDGDEYISATPVPISRVVSRSSQNNGLPPSNTSTIAGAQKPSSSTPLKSNKKKNNNETGGSETNQPMGSANYIEEGNLTAFSPTASSFGATSFNGFHSNGAMLAQSGNGACHNASFFGAESGYGSLNSVCRSRQSFSYSMKQTLNNEGDSVSSRAPLLRPLAGVSRPSAGQRHNPYGESSSLH